MKPTIPSLVALAALTAACAPVPREPAPVAGLSTAHQCFFTRMIYGYNEAPDGPAGDRLYITTGPHERWLFETYGSCPELDWSHRIALDTRADISLCTGDTATLIVPTGLGAGVPQRCTVRLLGKMIEPR
jgi:hypothetical protein